MKPRDFRDPRLLLLSAALSLALLALVAPRASVKRASFDVLVVVDITGSMNTRDYSAAGRPISRLEFVKTALAEMIGNLPCASRVALAVFSERRPFLLFEPIETCANYAPLEGSIRALDWRMAWEGDSRIAAGLFRAIEMARELKTDLLFLTDGQEAPPLSPSGPPPFEGRPGEVRGLIVGVGGRQLSPIPKYDDNGREIGFYGVEDVPHDNRFGLPPAGAEMREDYNARNAPFGAAGRRRRRTSFVRPRILSAITLRKDWANVRPSRRHGSALTRVRDRRHATIPNDRTRSAPIPRGRRWRCADRALHLPASFRMACRRST